MAGSQAIRSEFMSGAADLINFAMGLSRPDFTVFVNFSGHICQLDIQAFAGGWYSHADHTGQWQIFLNEECPDIQTDFQRIKDEILAHSENVAEEIEKSRQRKEECERKQYENLKAKFEPTSATM